MEVPKHMETRCNMRAKAGDDSMQQKQHHTIDRECDALPAVYCSLLTKFCSMLHSISVHLPTMHSGANCYVLLCLPYVYFKPT